MKYHEYYHYYTNYPIEITIDSNKIICVYWYIYIYIHVYIYMVIKLLSMSIG